MIKSFRNKALKRYWEKSDTSGVRPEWVRKVKLLLDALNRAKAPTDMWFPGSGFHALSGDLAGRFALLLSRNWRMTFGWEGQDAIDVDMEDYHGK